MDFQLMSPIEFEEFVAKVFRGMGFRTQLTQSSGDGGIDIIAKYDGEIFKGTYLIQCKHWKRNVGEPPIRDLYGVIQSENALKGIVVTTSDFSSKAMEFTKGKNIDLINGNSIQKIAFTLEKQNGIKQPIFSEKTRGFIEEKGFPIDRYNILTNQIEEYPNLQEPYLKLIELLLEQSLIMNDNIKRNGLLKDLFYYAKKFKQEFTKKNDNASKGNRIGINYVLTILNIIKGDFIEAYQLLTDLRNGYDFKTTWSVPGWNGLPNSTRKYCELTFNAMLSLFDMSLNDGEKELSPKIIFPLNFNYYVKSKKFLTTVSIETEEISLKEFVDKFKLKEEENFQSQGTILSEIVNKDLY